MDISYLLLNQLMGIWLVLLSGCCFEHSCPRFYLFDIIKNIFKEADSNKIYKQSLVLGIILRGPSDVGIRKISISLAYLVLFFGFEENLVYSVYFFFLFQARLQRGHLLLKQGKLDEAEDDFKKVVSSVFMWLC